MRRTCEQLLYIFILKIIADFLDLIIVLNLQFTRPIAPGPDQLPYASFLNSKHRRIEGRNSHKDVLSTRSPLCEAPSIPTRTPPGGAEAFPPRLLSPQTCTLCWDGIHVPDSERQPPIHATDTSSW